MKVGSRFLRRLEMSIEGLLQMLVQLGGVGALIAVVVNVLKTTGVVKDGQAAWTRGEPAALAALFGVSGVEAEPTWFAGQPWREHWRRC
jgi:DNA polymerase/3'-5' exonuclease PolX